MARPSKYNPKYHVPWAKSLAMDGRVEREIATAMEVSMATLSRWKNEYPEFAEALSKGKEPADAEIELSLFKRAKGYTYKEKKVIVAMDKDGNQKPARIETVEKEVAPDTTACIFWLKNRRPDKYRDKQDIVLDNEKEIIFNIAKASEMIRDGE